MPGKISRVKDGGTSHRAPPGVAFKPIGPQLMLEFSYHLVFRCPFDIMFIAQKKVTFGNLQSLKAHHKMNFHRFSLHSNKMLHVFMCEVIETADGLGIVTIRVRFVIVGMFLCVCVSTFSNCRNNKFPTKK